VGRPLFSGTQLNGHSEPKEVADEEYQDFYKAVAKDTTAETLGWSHFKVRSLGLYEISLT
jgi:HSP90 family molecular chaperone